MDIHASSGSTWALLLRATGECTSDGSRQGRQLGRSSTGRRPSTGRTFPQFSSDRSAVRWSSLSLMSSSAAELRCGTRDQLQGLQLSSWIRCCRSYVKLVVRSDDGLFSPGLPAQLQDTWWPFGRDQQKGRQSNCGFARVHYQAVTHPSESLCPACTQVLTGPAWSRARGGSSRRGY